MIELRRKTLEIDSDENSSGRFQPREESLVEEIDDGEVVLVDLRTTNGYTINGSGVAVWEGIRAGMTAAEIAGLVAGTYTADIAEIRAGVDGLLDQLLSEGLIEPVQVSTGSLQPTIPRQGADASRPFEPPVLTKIASLPGQDLSAMQGYAVRFG